MRSRIEPRANTAGHARHGYERTREGSRALQEWLHRREPIPFELRDLAMVKLFFAGALEPAGADRLLAELRVRSEERVETLEAIRPEGDAAQREGNVHPLLTLELGLAVHRAIVDVCRRFEQRSGRSPRMPARRRAGAAA